MYHPAKKFTMHKAILALACANLLGAALTTTVNAEPVSVAASQPALSSNLSFVQNEFPTLPASKKLKKRPTKAEIYQWDDKPLGNRSPFLFVHGLRGEYYKSFRWAKIIKKFTSNPEFDSKYSLLNAT